MSKSGHIIIAVFSILLFYVQISGVAQIDTSIVQLEKQLERDLVDTVRIDVNLHLAEKYSSVDIKKSEHYARQALDISSRINYKKGIAYANYQIAKIFSDSEFDLAEVFILKSVEAARETGDSILTAHNYMLIGNMKCDSWSYDEAYKYFNRALGIYRRHHANSSVAGAYNNIGMVNSSQGKDSIAISYYLKAVLMNKTSENREWLATNYLNIGSTYNVMGLYDSSFQYLYQSLNIAREYNILRLLPWIYNSLSQGYIGRSDYKRSKQFSLLAIHFAILTNNNYQLQEAYQSLKNQFLSLNSLDSACYYFDKICVVKDSIKLHERTRGIDMLEISYMYQDEIKLNQLNHKKQQMNLLLIIAGLIILIGIATTFFLLQRLKAREKQLENERLKREKLILQNEMEIKTREVTYKMLHITNQNQLINKVVDILSVKGSDPAAESPNVFNDIISELRLNQKLDLWDAFEKEFTQLHPDFFRNLLHDIPNLTQYEKRLCAFLKLNMNSKEIADILHLNYESILKARTRLRKKLNLTGTDENLNTMLGKY